MKALWKWIIGIVLGLVVLALIAGGVWLVASRVGGIPHYVQVQPQTNPVPNGRGPSYGNGDHIGPWMMPNGGRGYPMMRGRGFGFNMMPFGGIFGGLVCLGFLLLLGLGIFFLVRNMSKRTTVPAAAVAAASPTPPTPAMHACKNCGQPVQDGSAYCSNCGEKQ